MGLSTDNRAKKKGRRSDLFKFEVRRAELLSCLVASNLAGLEATGANIHFLALAIDNDSNTLDVWLKGAGHSTVRVGDGATGNGVLTAEITDLRHE